GWSTGSGPPAGGGVTFDYSALTGTGAFPALISCGGPTGTAGSNVYLRVRNIAFKSPSNPSLGAVNAANAVCFVGEDLALNPGVLAASISRPTHDNVVGFYLPTINNHAVAELRRVNILGQRIGVRFSE